MRALKFNDTWNITLRNVEPVAILQPDDVIVQVKYCGICGTDVGIVSGDYPVAVKGVTIGHEATGIVHAVGTGVTNVAVGDRVAINPTFYCGTCRMCQSNRINHCENKFGTESGVSYDGTFADLFRTTSGYVHKIPDDVSMQAVALTEPLSCILAGMRKLSGTPVQAYTYLFGAGPMGVLYAWALALKGLVPVVIETSPARRAYASTCLPGVVKIYASLDEARREYFNDPKAPIDLVVDTTSGLLQDLYPMLACGATYMAIGLKNRTAAINSMQLADKSLSIVGSIDSLQGTFMEAFKLITTGIIPAQKLVSHVMPLAQYQEAFAVVGCDMDAKAMVPSAIGSCKVLLEI